MKLGSCNGKTDAILGLDGAGHMSNRPGIVPAGLASYLSEVSRLCVSCFINPQTLKDEHCSGFACEASPRGKDPETCAVTASAITAQLCALMVRLPHRPAWYFSRGWGPGGWGHAEFLMFFLQL